MSEMFSTSAWEKVWTYRGTFLLGLFNTVRTAFLALFVALVLGIIFGLMATSGKKIAKAISRVYVELIQNTPLLLQICFFILCICFFWS